MSQYNPSYGQPVGGPTWMGSPPRPKPLDRYTAMDRVSRAGDPQARRAEAMQLGLIPMDAPPQAQGGGSGRGGGGGGGGPSYGFAQTNFANGDRYNDSGYRADGRKKIQGFSADAAGLPDFGGLDQFYAQQDRSVPAFYNGSENSTGQSAAEVAGRVQAKGNMLVPVGDEGLSMVEPRAQGGPVVPGQPYLVGKRGPELIVPKQAGTVIPNDALPQRGTPGYLQIARGLPAPAPMLAPAAPLPPMQIDAPAMSGVTAPEMRPAPGLAAAGPQTGQVAQFMGPDPTVQYSSAPPTRSAGAMPTRLPPELAQAPALMPGMSYYQTRLAQRNFSRSPAGVQFFLNQQEYDRRNPQPAAVTAAAAPGMVPEGFMAVPKTFLPNGQVQSWGLQPKPEAPADVTPKLVPLPGTAYGMAFAGDRPMNTVPMQQPTESPSRISKFLMTQVARAEKPETLRQLMNSTEDWQVIEAASKKLENLAPKDSTDQIYRVDPVTNKLQKETWQKGKKLPPGGWQRMEDENNNGVPDAQQQPLGGTATPAANRSLIDRLFARPSGQ